MGACRRGGAGRGGGFVEAVKLEKLTAAEIAAHVSTAAGQDWRLIAEEIDSGSCEAWRVNAGEAFMVTRIEHRTNELVVVCFEGRGLRAVADAIMEQAKHIGCRSIRFHTGRPALGKMMQRFGFDELERVYRADLTGRANGQQQQ